MTKQLNLLTRVGRQFPPTVTRAMQTYRFEVKFYLRFEINEPNEANDL